MFIWICDHVCQHRASAVPIHIVAQWQSVEGSLLGHVEIIRSQLDRTSPLIRFIQIHTNQRLSQVTNHSNLRIWERIDKQTEGIPSDPTTLVTKVQQIFPLEFIVTAFVLLGHLILCIVHLSSCYRVNRPYEDATFFVATYKLRETFFIVGHIYEHAQERTVKSSVSPFTKWNKNENAHWGSLTKGWPKKNLLHNFLVKPFIHQARSSLRHCWSSKTRVSKWFDHLITRTMNNDYDDDEGMEMANMWRAFMSETTLLSELLSIEVFLSSAHNHDDDDTGHKDDTCGMWICCYSMFSLCLRSSIKVNGYSKGGCKSGKGGQVGLKDSCERFHGKSIPSSATADFSPDPASQNFCRSCKFAQIWKSTFNQSNIRPINGWICIFASFCHKIRVGFPPFGLALVWWNQSKANWKTSSKSQKHCKDRQLDAILCSVGRRRWLQSRYSNIVLCFLTSN